jgi:hypothetical protein
MVRRAESLKILSLNLSGRNEYIHAKPNPNILHVVCCSKWAPEGQEWNCSKFNCCNISVAVGDRAIVRVR